MIKPSNSSEQALHAANGEVKESFVKRFRVPLGVTALSLAFIGNTLTETDLPTADEIKEWPRTEYVVKSGDTLWGIADIVENSNDPLVFDEEGNLVRESDGEDVRQYVSVINIKEINGLETSDISPGDKLEIPKYVQDDVNA